MTELAQDISCPEIVVRLAGQETALRFDHTAMRNAELYNLAVTGKRINYLALLNMASSLCYTGLAAIVYGAASAVPGSRMTPERFDAAVSLGDCLAVQGAVLQAAFDALPEVAGVTPKNAESRTASPSTPGNG